MTITKRITSIALALIVTLTGFTMLTANQASAKTVNYTPKITYCKISQKYKRWGTIYGQYQVRWNAPAKAYKNWSVQVEHKKFKKAGATTIDKTKASYQYYVRETTIPSDTVRIRFKSGNNYTKWSAWKTYK